MGGGPESRCVGRVYGLDGAAHCTIQTVHTTMEITEKLDKDIKLINDILQLENTTVILITMDSNSRSKTWHDKLTNGRGNKLEEFIISKQLFVMNEESEMKSFHSSRGTSNIDLTISNSKLRKSSGVENQRRRKLFRSQNNLILHRAL